jgi:NAD(P)H-dependent flavin oxidoreductase YrpB (nitropropane dioxygenase family)
VAGDALHRHPEAYGHVNYKNRIVAIDEEGTVVTRGASGKPCRLLRNNFTREWERREAEILPFPISRVASGAPPRSSPARRGTSTTAMPRADRAPRSSSTSARLARGALANGPG